MHIWRVRPTWWGSLVFPTLLLPMHTRKSLCPSFFREAFAAWLWDAARNLACSSLSRVAASQWPLPPLPCLQPAPCTHCSHMCLTAKGFFLIQSSGGWSLIQIPDLPLQQIRCPEKLFLQISLYFLWTSPFCPTFLACRHTPRRSRDIPRINQDCIVKATTIYYPCLLYYRNEWPVWIIERDFRIGKTDL